MVSTSDHADSQLDQGIEQYYCQKNEIEEGPWPAGWDDWIARETACGVILLL